MYRAREDRSVLILHETWETHEAQQGYAIRPLKTVLLSQMTGALAQPMQTWEIEEMC